MKKRNNAFFLAAGLCLLTVVACSENICEGGNADADAVRIEFRLPGSVGGAVPVTRVMPLDTMTTHPLPEGSTMWMTVSEEQSDGSWLSSDPKPYVVLASGAGYNTLHACSMTSVTEDGVELLRIDPSVVTSPLYLKSGRYKFRMISPALDLVKTGLRAKIDNGIYFYSTDDRYENTEALPQQITVGTNGVQHIVLNPMIQQVARMQFTLCKGENVVDLDVLPAGIEISGLQNADETEPYNWSSENIADTLKMKFGDKRGRTVIKEFRQGTTTITENGTEVVKEAIIGDTGVLPTDARNNSISVLFNMKVNGAPTQYMVLLNNQVLRAAYTYNYRFVISEENGVTVATWVNQSWSTDVPLE